MDMNDILISNLMSISPMPDDGSMGQTSEVLDRYVEIVEALRKMIDDDPTLAEHLPPRCVIDAFGYGDGNGAYWLGVGLVRRLPKSKVLPALHEAILNGKPGPRQWSAMLLGQYRDHSAIPLLLQALDDPLPLIRADAAQSLGMIGDKASCGRLQELLNDPDEDVRECAALALSSLG